MYKENENKMSPNRPILYTQCDYVVNLSSYCITTTLYLYIKLQKILKEILPKTTFAIYIYMRYHLIIPERRELEKNTVTFQKLNLDKMCLLSER